MMIKKLLIPLCTLGTLALSAGQVCAASFVIDTFDTTTQATSVTNTNKFAQNQKTVPEAFGGSRYLSQLLTKNAGGLRFPASSQVIPKSPTVLDGYFAVANGSQVNSTVTLQYGSSPLNPSGQLYNKFVNGNSLGNFQTGKYAIDAFEVMVRDIDTKMQIRFSMIDQMNREAFATRTITKLPGGGIAINNPYIPGGYINVPKVAAFSITEMIQNCACSFDLTSVASIKLQVTGNDGYDGSIDMIRGLDIPEPSLVVGTAIALGIVFLSTKQQLDDDSQD